MQTQRRRDTTPERTIRRILYRRGLRYRVDHPIPSYTRRRADIMFRTARVAVFVDGCFWHGCPVHATWPKHNAAWWREKILANVARDRNTDDRLRAAGWRVVRCWEHEEPYRAAARIESAVRRRALRRRH